MSAGTRLSVVLGIILIPLQTTCGQDKTIQIISHDIRVFAQADDVYLFVPFAPVRSAYDNTSGGWPKKPEFLLIVTLRASDRKCIVHKVPWSLRLDNLAGYPTVQFVQREEWLYALVKGSAYAKEFGKRLNPRAPVQVLRYQPLAGFRWVDVQDKEVASVLSDPPSDLRRVKVGDWKESREFDKHELAIMDELTLIGTIEKTHSQLVAESTKYGNHLIYMWK